jgi:hypothetical protein
MVVCGCGVDAAVAVWLTAIIVVAARQSDAARAPSRRGQRRTMVGLEFRPDISGTYLSKRDITDKG